jgi:hypothetical protein
MFQCSWTVARGARARPRRRTATSASDSTRSAFVPETARETSIQRPPSARGGSRRPATARPPPTANGLRLEALARRSLETSEGSQDRRLHGRLRAGTSSPARSKKTPLSGAFLGADEGTRTPDLLHGKALEGVCAGNDSCPKRRSEQRYLGSKFSHSLPLGTPFCASAVRCWYGEIVVRFANGQCSSHLRCICVSALGASGRRSAC